MPQTRESREEEKMIEHKTEITTKKNGLHDLKITAANGRVIVEATNITLKRAIVMIEEAETNDA